VDGEVDYFGFARVSGMSWLEKPRWRTIDGG